MTSLKTYFTRKLIQLVKYLTSICSALGDQPTRTSGLHGEVAHPHVSSVTEPGGVPRWQQESWKSLRQTRPVLSVGRPGEGPVGRALGVS